MAVIAKGYRNEVAEVLFANLNDADVSKIWSLVVLSFQDMRKAALAPSVQVSP